MQLRVLVPLTLPTASSSGRLIESQIDRSPAGTPSFRHMPARLHGGKAANKHRVFDRPPRRLPSGRSTCASNDRCFRRSHSGAILTTSDKAQTLAHLSRRSGAPRSPESRVRFAVSPPRAEQLSSRFGAGPECNRCDRRSHRPGNDGQVVARCRLTPRCSGQYPGVRPGIAAELIRR